jgi:hypothetical protein
LNGWRAGSVGEGDSAAGGDRWGAERLVAIIILASCAVGVKKVVFVAGLGLWSALRGERLWARGGASCSLGSRSSYLLANSVKLAVEWLIDYLMGTNV